MKYSISPCSFPAGVTNYLPLCMSVCWSAGTSKLSPFRKRPPCDRDHDWINFGLAKRHYNLYEIAHATLPYEVLLRPVLVLLQGFWHNLLPNTRAAHTMWPPLSFGEPINSVSRWPHGREGCRDQSKEQCIGQRRGPRSAVVQHTVTSFPSRYYAL